MTHARITGIDSDQDLEMAVSQSMDEPVLLYKHSSLCELSGMARDSLLTLNQPADPPIFEVVVQTARPLSNTIEARWSIRHESPQAILIVGGTPVFDTSHRGVTATAIREAVAAAA